MDDTEHAADRVEAVFDQPLRAWAERPPRRKALRGNGFDRLWRRTTSGDSDITRTASSPAAWRSTWAAPDGPSLESIRPLALDIARNAGCEVLIDHRQGYLFFGALTDPGTAWDDPDTRDLMRRLATEDRWAHVWSQVLKQGANPPTIQHGRPDPADPRRAVAARRPGPGRVCAVRRGPPGGRPARRHR